MTRIVTRTLPHTEAGNDPNDRRDDPTYLTCAESADLVSWTEDFTVSDSEIAQLRSPEWIVENLVIRGHLLIIAAEPNGGKTTIFAHLSDEIVEAGYRVFYVNADIAGSDAARFLEMARAGGWTPLLPDLKPGLSMTDVVENLRVMNDAGGDMNDMVFIFDTLKKMADVIVKKQLRELLSLFRSLTAKGMTIICLAHTNKYKDQEGRPIFEGTGDIRADADELIYMIPHKHPDGAMTVSTEPDKVRGDFKPITFRITADRKVERVADYIDTAAERALDERYKNDVPDIRVILDAIEAGNVKQTEIIEFCKGHRIGKRSALRILREYEEGPRQQWKSQRGLERNTVRYHPLETQS
jgi:hypothetical protein